jgi:ATP adenylyltransferase
MQRMFAGWRMQYVSKAVKTRGCLFCALVRKGDDPKRWILERGPHAFLVLNAFPYNSGHSMVALNRHKGTVSALTGPERADVWRMMSRAERAIGRVYKPEGMNLGINIGHCAGAGVVGHLHVHLVPRWYGDSNFMSVIGDTKVLPEDLTDTYARLSKALARIPQ